MAAKKSTATASAFYKLKSKKRNKGIHAKNLSSKNKKSKKYLKRYVGQGRR